MSPKSCSWFSAASQRRRAAQHFAELVLQDLRVQQLLAVFPLVQRLGFVEPLVALQADHLQPAPCRDRLRELGLADAGGAFDQDRLLDLLRQVDRGRDLPARDIACAARPLSTASIEADGLISATGFQLRIQGFRSVLPAFWAKNKPFGHGSRQILVFRLAQCEPGRGFEFGDCLRGR